MSLACYRAGSHTELAALTPASASALLSTVLQGQRPQSPIIVSLHSLIPHERRSWTPVGPGMPPGGRTGTFRVLFTGDLKPGVRAEDAKARLARLLQVDTTALEDLFSGGERCGGGLAIDWAESRGAESHLRINEVRKKA